MTTSPRQAVILIGLVLALGAACFWPLVAGKFLFDDFANLPALGAYGPVSDWPSLARFLSAGIADPLGRPIAQASFLLDARDWPADPTPFLRTNLLIHLANALALAGLLVRLGNLISADRALVRKAAIIGMAVWCLHPLWVSTVGYVVQRHAMLATTFVLLGLHAWLLAVQAFREGHNGRGLAWAGVTMPLCGLLAVLSKANGMLLPLLALVLQYFAVAPARPAPPAERLATRVLLVIPSLMLLFALAWQIDPEAPTRPWTLAERLLSQPRAIADYLLHILAPRVNSPGLFADGFEVSQGLLSPLTTLPALLFVLLLGTMPFLMKRHAPALATAIAFYLAGHLMESTVLPLELYFEHRNYLPALLLGWGLAFSLFSQPRLRRGATALLAIYLLALPVLTHQRARLWADAPKQAAVWARQLPDSPRAQTWAAQHELQAGQTLQARDRLEDGLAVHPKNSMLALNLVDLDCALGAVRPSTLQTAVAALETSGTRQDMNYKWLRNKLQTGATTCPGLDTAAMATLVAAARRHDADIVRARSRNHQLAAMLELARLDCPAAELMFLRALETQRRDSDAYANAALLASRCGAPAGKRLLDAYERLSMPRHREPWGMPRIHAWVLDRQGYWERELMRLRDALNDPEDERRSHVPAAR